MALVESNVPMALKIFMDGRFEELGRVTYGGKLKHRFTAHPKTDPETKEMMFFGYGIDGKPYCTYSVASADGELLRSTDIGIERPVMIHDFAITENYSVFMDHPLLFAPRDIVSGKFAFRFDNELPSRIGIIPRHSNSAKDVTWFEFSAGYSFHTVNSWEEGDEVVLICCRSNNIQLDALDGCLPCLHEYRVNLKTGESSERDLFSTNCEFPTIHPGKVGRKTKFCYLGEMNGDALNFHGCFKVNLEDNSVVGRILYGKGRTGGECVFVPKQNEQSEDDGYLLTFVFDETSGSSSLWIMDAKTMASEPLAIVELPQRVPYGFHGIWVSEEQIQNQKHQL